MSAANSGMGAGASEPFIEQRHDCVRERPIAEYGAERFFRDGRFYRIYDGTTQILQLQIAEHMLREFHSGAMGKDGHV